MKNRGSTIALILGVLFLGGCASKAPKDFDFAKNPNEGVAVFAVSHDSEAGRGVTLMVYLDRESNPLVNAPYASVKDVAGIRTGSDFEDDYGRLAVVNLPPGKHNFSFWQITNGSGLRIMPTKDLPPLEFEIKSGSIVYLGDFHGITATGRNIFGIKITGGGYPELRDSHERDFAVLDSKYPQFHGKAQIQLLPLGPWLSEDIRKQIEPGHPAIH
jgi:hypothetical protein